MWTKYIVFVFLIGICYGFVLISSAADQNDFNPFPASTRTVYQMHSTVLLSENGEHLKNVGFFITADILVDSIGESDGDKILKIELRAPQLHTRSRKAPSPDGFIPHSSKLESFSLKPFYITWHRGRIGKIYFPKKEPIALANIKRGIASLLQFQIGDLETNETDASGFCQIAYHSIDVNIFQKIKTNCVGTDLPQIQTNDPILEAMIKSTRKVTYELDPQLTYIKHVYAKETHKMNLAFKEELRSTVEADQVLNFVKSEKINEEKLTIPKLIETISNEYDEDSVVIKKENVGSEDLKSLSSVIAELKDNLATKNLGSLNSAKAFLKVLEAARRATRDEIVKVLGSKKNQKILPQIYDILGYVQTPDVHFSVLKKLHFDKEDHLDNSERYLWSLSLAPNPNLEILQDLIERYRKNTNYPEKVKETLILTIAAMARLSNQRKIIRQVEEIIENNFNHAKGENRYIFLRAIKNLKSSSTIPFLLNTIKKGTSREGVLSFRALRALSPNLWTSTVLQTARNAFLQLDRKYDSSARTLAVDILLESTPNDDTIIDLLYYLQTNDTNSEVKQYVMQRLEMKAAENQTFGDRVISIIKSDASLNNYYILSPKGLSTALKRDFLTSSSTNGSLVTIQEIQDGIVKRGIVNVMMEKDFETKEIFSLGIFAGGLGSFMGGGSDGDDESANAGMELTILDRQVRPFVFFSGQGELMGHVWSGTASERTTAFQSLILLQDHLEYIRLSPGFVAEFNLKGGMSFDLSGNIEISIWSRTADSLVEKAAGIISSGLITIDTSFVRSQIEFSASIEPKLSLKSDLDFSGKVQLCMRVTQPDSIFRHNVFKIERIPGSKHKLRFAKYKKSFVPGTTYSLNRKNNEMCSAMLN